MLIRDLILVSLLCMIMAGSTVLAQTPKLKPTGLITLEKNLAQTFKSFVNDPTNFEGGVRPNFELFDYAGDKVPILESRYWSIMVRSTESGKRYLFRIHARFPDPFPKGGQVDYIVKLQPIDANTYRKQIAPERVDTPEPPACLLFLMVAAMFAMSHLAVHMRAIRRACAN